MHLSTMQQKDSPSQYNVVQILLTLISETLKTSNLYLFDNCSIWDNVWEVNLILLVFFFLQTGRRASTHGASGKRSKVSVIVHSTTSPLRMCYSLASQTLSVCLCLACLSFIYHKYTPRMFTLRHNSYPQGTIQVWDFKNKKKKNSFKRLL